VAHDGGMMDGGMMDGGMMDMMSGMMGAWMVLWALIGLALLALVVVATVWLAKRISPGQSPSSAGVDEILRRRYAAGEINQEDYLRMRDELSRR
jgi:putative membrane protein